MSEWEKLKKNTKSSWFRPFVFMFLLVMFTAYEAVNAQVQQSGGGGGGNVNVTQLNGTTTSTNNGTTDAGSLRVTLSSDSTGQVKLATGANAVGSITNTGFNVTGTLPAGSNTIGTVRATPLTSCGTSAYDSTITSLPTTEAAATATATCVDVIYCDNLTASAQTFSIKDNAGTPIVYVNAFSLPANSNILLTFGGIKFNLGVRWVATNSASLNCQIKGAQ